MATPSAEEAKRKLQAQLSKASYDDFIAAGRKLAGNVGEVSRAAGDFTGDIVRPDKYFGQESSEASAAARALARKNESAHASTQRSREPGPVWDERRDEFPKSSEYPNVIEAREQDAFAAQQAENPNQSYEGMGPASYDSFAQGPNEARTLEQNEIDRIAEELAASTGQTVAVAKAGMNAAGITTGRLPPEVRDEVKKNDPDPVVPEEKTLLQQARDNVFGKGSAFYGQGEIADNAMKEIALSQNRMKEIAIDSRENLIRQQNYLKESEAEQLRIKLAERKYKKKEFAIEEENARAQKEVHEEFYGSDGYLTKWLKAADAKIENIEEAASDSEDGNFGFSDWSQTFRTVGAVVALGANIAGKVILEKKGLGNALPVFMIPLIMKGVEADMRRDEDSSSSAKGAALAHSGMATDFMNILGNKQGSIAQISVVGISAAQKRLKWMQSLLPGTPGSKPRARFMQQLVDELEIVKLDKMAEVEKTFMAAASDQLKAATNYGAAIDAADLARTSQGTSQINALKAIESMSAAKTPKLIWTSIEKTAEAAERGFLVRGAEIRRQAAEIIALSGGELTSLETIMTITVADLAKRFIDDESGIYNKILTLQANMKAQVTAYGKSFENRLSNTDITRYEKMLPGVEDSSMVVAMSLLDSAIYGIKESYIARMAVAKNSGDYEQNRQNFQSALGAEPDTVLNNYLTSVSERNALGDAGMSRRVDVGMVPFNIIVSDTSALSKDLADSISRKINQGSQGSFSRDFVDDRENTRRYQQDGAENPGSLLAPSNPGQPVTPGSTATKPKTGATQIHPLMEVMKTTSAYNKEGETRKINGVRKRHKGIDLTAKVGTKINAPFKGKVTEVGLDGNKVPNGNFIKIVSDETGEEWTLIHLSTVEMKVGDAIAPGMLIALSGKSGKGNVDEHVHLQVQDQQGLLKDPGPILASSRKLD
tara:strand:+ start:3159 stop:5978 length:2820 start_codon:yes stop_codon:yes gene_type:complete